MRDSDIKKIWGALAQLVHAHTMMDKQLRNITKVLDRELEPNGFAESKIVRAKISTNSQFPVANRQTLSIDWGGKSCFLGNTLPFLFFERLARSPNQYVAYIDLLEDVWGDKQRSDSTIRGVVKRLRDRLIAGDMRDLALSINGRESGFYCLKLV